MRAHWLSTSALIAVAAFAAGALFWEAIRSLDPAWLGVAVLAGLAVALVLHRLSGTGRRR